MEMVGTVIKWMIAIGLVGVGAYWLYQWQQSQPLDEKDVTEIAQTMAKVIGDTKTELSTTDLAAIEFNANRMGPLSTTMITKGLLKLGPSLAEHVAAEIILLRVFETRPEKYMSAIDGDPWTVQGDTMRLSNFQINRDVGDVGTVEDMLSAFNGGPKRRDK